MPWMELQHENAALKMAEQKMESLLGIKDYEASISGLPTSICLSLDAITIVSLSHIKSQLHATEGVY